MTSAILFAEIETQRHPVTAGCSQPAAQRIGFLRAFASSCLGVNPPSEDYLQSLLDPT